MTARLIETGKHLVNHSQLKVYNQGPLSVGELKITDDGIRKRDEIVTQNFFSKGIPLCGVLGGGYNKDFDKLVELHSILHQSCAKLL